jgi:hypothetical protein
MALGRVPDLCWWFRAVYAEVPMDFGAVPSVSRPLDSRGCDLRSREPTFDSRERGRHSTPSGTALLMIAEQRPLSRAAHGVYGAFHGDRGSFDGNCGANDGDFAKQLARRCLASV